MADQPHGAKPPAAKGAGGGGPPGGKKPAPPPPSGVKFSEIILVLIGIVIIGSFATAFTPEGATSGIAAFALNVYDFLKTVATIICMVALVIVVYAYIRVSEIASEETKKLGLALNWNSERTQKNARWEKVEQYMTSLNSSDWKIAILEADNILDDITERIGYKGATLGERMKTIEASDFPYLEEAWQAHKLRNAIAHKGTDYALTRSEAEQAINIYHRIFKSLGYL